MSEPVWIDKPSVLWENGNWMKIWPRSDMSPAEMSNAIARLSVVGGGTLALLFRSSMFVGIGMLGLLLSSQMARQKRSVKVTETTIPAETVKGGQTKRAKPKTSTQPALEYPQLKNVQQKPDQNLQSWNNFFGAPGTDSRNGVDATSGAMGAYVALANGSRDQQGISQFAPASAFDQLAGPNEGVVDPNLVPAADVKEFLSGNYTLRTPFPRPVTAQEITSNDPSSNPFAASYPFQAGFPTQFGPAPTAKSPQPSQFVLPFAAQAANSAVGIGAYQPSQPVTFGAFASDGGATSTPIIPPVPSGTVGNNFETDYFTPRHLAPAGSPLASNPEACFAPNHENPLGNVPLGLNGVARPRLCPPVDPRSQSQKFLTALYESPAQQAAGYQFFQNPQQDMIQAQDDFLKWVYKDTQTHFKDKYSEPERAGLYNITDLNGPLGF